MQTAETRVVNGHTGGGITAGKNAQIVSNILSGNVGNMIVVSDGSVVKGNTVTLNSGSSTSGIQVTQNCRVIDNIIGNSCSSGVNAFGINDTISGNTISGCVEGIEAGSSMIITGNNISGCTDNGIQAGTDCIISNNNLIGNTNVGVTADARTLFLNNVANFNGAISEFT